jgi:predicted DNA-binding protein (UPF0251 family)
MLDESEREMLNLLFYENISECEYEKRYGVPRETLVNRRDNLLKKLKSFIINLS